MAFRSKPPGQRALADADLICNRVEIGVAVRQQGHDGIFNACTKRAPMLSPPAKRILTTCDQHFVQMMIGADDWRNLYRRRKRKLINGRAKLDIPAEEFNQFRASTAAVGEPDARRYQPGSCQLAAQADQ